MNGNGIGILATALLGAFTAGDIVAYLAARALGQKRTWARDLMWGSGYYMLWQCVCPDTFETQCHFCGKPKQQVGTLIVSRDWRTSICNECVEVCTEHLKQPADQLDITDGEPAKP